MGQKGFNRREALGLGAGAAAVAGAALVPGSAGAQDGAARRRPAEDLVPRQNIGIQLYSLRDMQAASVQNTINLLGGIGYPEVELFTMQGQTAATWRGILEAANVRALAAHVGIDRWRNELDTVLNEAETLGMQYVGVPGIFPNPPATQRDLSRARARVRPLRGAGRRPRDAVLLPQPQLRVRARRRDPAVRHPPRPDGSRPRLLRDGPVLDGDGRRRPARLPRGVTTSRAGRCSTSRTVTRRARSRTWARATSTSRASSASSRTSTTTTTSSSATRRSTRRGRPPSGTSTCATCGDAAGAGPTRPRKPAAARPPRERGGRRDDPGHLDAAPGGGRRHPRRHRGAAVRGGRPGVPGPVAVPEGHAERPSRRAHEPGGASGRARAARRAHGRDPPAQPEQRDQQHRHRHEGGPAGALSARRGGRPGHRHRPGVRGQPLGLRLLLAEAEHADGRARHRHQRG